MQRRGRRSLIVLLLFLTGCAAGYSGLMKGSLKRLERRDYEGALVKLEKPQGKTNKLLYRFEKGLILHYQGAYQASNREFEKAEGLIDKLYTRSISREVAALLTNDAIRPYSGEEFERALIHYYRALNYQYLGEPQEALVECRKANLRLEDYAAAAEYELSYKNDAFIQYMTGLFFEAEGELNDAYIAYRDAEKGYRAYERLFGLRVPRMLARDLGRLAVRMGYEEDVEDYVKRYQLSPAELAPEPGGEVIVFAETGFIARKRQREINVPILESDDTSEIWVQSDRMVYRYHHAHSYSRVKYWLRVALPVYQEMPTQVRRVRLSGGGQSAEAVLVEDLDAIAFKSFGEKEDTILLRTLARALAKYLLTQKIEKENEILGALFNLFGASTEAADTRSWVSLPGRIQIARLALPPGTVDLDLEFLNEGGQVIESAQFPGIEVVAGKKVFLNYRSFR